MPRPMEDPDGLFTHTLPEELAERTVTQRLRRRFALMLPAMMLGVVASAALARAFTPGSLAFMATLVLVAMVVTYRRVLQRELVAWRSFRLARTSRLVRRVMAGLAPVEVSRAQVAKVVLWPGRGLALHGVDGEELLFVPEDLERYEDAREALASWVSVVETGRPASLARLQGPGVVIALATLASWYGTSAEDARVATLAGISLILHAGGIAWVVLRDAHVRAQHKAVVALVLMAFAGGALVPLASRILGPG
jgi:hypothetical protein